MAPDTDRDGVPSADHRANGILSRRFRPLVPPLAALIFVGGLGAQAVAQTPNAPAYVGSETCAECHAGQMEAWSDSDHGLAWTLPGEDTVLADFDNTEFAAHGVIARFRREATRYLASVTETDGVTRDYEVHSVIGVEPLQQYLFETEPGRLQSFDIVWDTEKKTWFHLYPDQDLPPDDGLHWTGPYKNWNGRCAECHATGYEKKYDPKTRIYASTQAEIGVGCEACHGPGEAHLAWTEGREPEASSVPLDPFGFTMAFDGGNTEAEIQQCAGCHSLREAYGDGNPLPGTPYHDAYNLSLLTPNAYHADGQILGEVYVYGSFLQSKMYERGVGCMNCHDPHTTELKAEGNAVCTQCHSPAGNSDFPTLKLATYDSPEHHFHPDGSPGAECKSCHMTERTYMGNDLRADHSFRIPRPDLSAFTGAPDACTGCHQDQSADWAAERIADWYPDSTKRNFHYGLTLARGRENPAAARDALIALAEATDVPAIARATALGLLQPVADPELAARFEPLLSNESALIRTEALELQRAAPPRDRVLRVINLLDDPATSVRFAAARQMLDAPVAQFPRDVEVKLTAAMKEWQASLTTRADYPETQLAIAGTALVTRNFPAAVAAFREAVTLDPQLVDAWVMLVRIPAALGDIDAARSALDEALAVNPDDPRLQAFAAELEAEQP